MINFLTYPKFTCISFNDDLWINFNDNYSLRTAHLMDEYILLGVISVSTKRREDDIKNKL